MNEKMRDTKTRGVRDGDAAGKERDESCGTVRMGIPSIGLARLHSPSALHAIVAWLTL